MCWHRWSRWEQYTQQYAHRSAIDAASLAQISGDLEKITYTRSRIREKRTCEKCGAYQDRIAAELFE